MNCTYYKPGITTGNVLPKAYLTTTKKNRKTHSAIEGFFEISSCVKAGFRHCMLHISNEF